MTDVLERVYLRLTNDTAVSSLVGTRVYPSNSVPQSSSYPFCVMTVITGLRKIHLGGWSGKENATMQIDCIGGTATQVKQLVFAVVEALVDSNSGFAVGSLSSNDIDTGVEGEFRTLLNVSIWHDER